MVVQAVYIFSFNNLIIDQSMTEFTSVSSKTCLLTHIIWYKVKLARFACENVLESSGTTVYFRFNVYYTHWFVQEQWDDQRINISFWVVKCILIQYEKDHLHRCICYIFIDISMYWSTLICSFYWFIINVFSCLFVVLAWSGFLHYTESLAPYLLFLVSMYISWTQDYHFANYQKLLSI